jgi:hypothetical protein
MHLNELGGAAREVAVVTFMLAPVTNGSASKDKPRAVRRSEYVISSVKNRQLSTGYNGKMDQIGPIRTLKSRLRRRGTLIGTSLH